MSLLEIEEMDLDEINDMISEENFAHLGCCKDNVPYVIPINYAFIEPYIYIYTTEGKKSEIIVANPHVCLQVEHIKSRDRVWVCRREDIARHWMAQFPPG